MQSLARAKPLARQYVLQVMSVSDKSNSLCQVIELPVGRVIFQLKLANNGEVLAGVLFQGQYLRKQDDTVGSRPKGLTP